MKEYPASAALDAGLAAAFGGEDGGQRMGRALVRYESVVGPVYDDDEDRALLRLLRADWALCDALDEDGRTWAWRTAESGVLEPEVARELLCSRAGIWALWPGDPPLARCRLTGLCVRLVDPDLEVADGTNGPLALWDARLLLREDGARLCRPPLVLPTSAADVVGPPARPGNPEVTIPRVRTSLLRWRRARRRHPFRLAPAPAG